MARKRIAKKSNRTYSERGRKPNSKGATTKQKMEEDPSKSTNNPAWYAADPNLLRDAASIPFSWPTGATKWHDLSLWSNVNTAPYSDIPGIASFKVVPAVGTALRSTDPINVAAQSVYSFVRHANSGHSNYDVPDLMLYILAMANFYSALVWCQRLYGYALTYDQRNRYVPRELIRLNNVDPDDLVANLANFRFWINSLIAKAASFAVPATFSIFSRMSFMYSGLYCEGTSIKDQLYQFIPDGFYQFNINSGSGLGELVYQKIDRSALMSVAQVEAYVDAMFTAIWNQEDFGIMSGDVLKAYAGNIIKLTSIPEAYTIIPVFDPMVLTQMKNAKLLDAEPGSISQTGTNANVIQIISPHTYTTSDLAWDGTPLNSGAVTAATSVRLNMLKDYKVLTVDTDQPDPAVVIEATRLMYGYDDYLAELRVGSEYIDQVILTYDVGSDYSFTQFNMPSMTSAAMGLYLGKQEQVARHFHYMPAYSALMGSTGSGSGVASWDMGEFFDLDNFAVLDNSDVIKMHQAATINMYAVPSVGKV